MAFGKLGKQQAIGIDIGADSVKAVTLAKREKRPALIAVETLDTGAEGILNETELYASVADWLKHSDWAKGRQVIGLPQYLATTQISDFPVGNNDMLDDMVSYETQQLAGLSDEVFVHDYQLLPPRYGRKNPVLIGICREAAVRERLDNLQAGGLLAEDLAINGVACFSALCFLHPECTRETEKPQLILDFGKESTTVVVFAAEQMLYTGSIDFGSQQVTQAIATKLKGDENAAETRKKEISFADLSPGSPVRDLLRRFDSELQDAIEHWRAQESSTIKEQAVSAIWMSGGGACQTGFDEILADRFECPARLFGPPLPGTSEMHPEHTTALGLALQGINLSAVPLSLLPGDIKWKQRRTARFPILMLALAALALLLTILTIGNYLHAKRMLTNQEAWSNELSECDNRIARLQKMTYGIQLQEARVIPLVEKGNQTRRFLRAFAAVSQQIQEGEWLIYMADDISYENGKITDKDRKLMGTSNQQGMALGGSVKTGIGDIAIPPEFPNLLSAGELQLTSSIIVAGYAPLVITDPYGAVKRIQSGLNEMEEYTNVDLLADTEQMGREGIFSPWLSFLRKNPNLRSKSFTLRLPFARLDVRKPVVHQAKKRSKK